MKVFISSQSLVQIFILTWIILLYLIWKRTQFEIVLYYKLFVEVALNITQWHQS